jgi:class 3 adenylate cyclase
MPDLPRGTVAFLFTDIVGSTQLWRTHREAMERAYVRHDPLRRQAISVHGEVVDKDIGNAVYAAVPTVPRISVAALDGQRALVTKGSDLVGRFWVHLALHAGETEPDV